jgi:hypothetical protein
MIRTNFNNRQFLYSYEVPETIVNEYKENDPDNDFDDYWIKYKGSYLHLSEFMRIDGDKYWNGVCGICNTAAYLIKITDNGESYQIALNY